MTYKVVLHHSDEGGCWSQGANEQEALENIRSAIQDYLAVVDDQTRGADVREVVIRD